MGVKKLKQQLAKYAAYGIDTCVFIYLFENHPRLADLAELVINNVVEGNSKGIASVINMMEVLVKPLKDGDSKLAVLYELMLRKMPNLTVVDVDVPIAIAAAGIRAKHGFRSPDSILLATTMENGGDAFITNEPRLKRCESIEVLVLGDYL